MTAYEIADEYIRIGDIARTWQYAGLDAPIEHQAAIGAHGRALDAARAEAAAVELLAVA